MLFRLGCALLRSKLYVETRPIIVRDVLTESSVIVSLHQQWTTSAILASCIFDLMGGGETTRITIVTICIAKIVPLEKLLVSVLVLQTPVLPSCLPHSHARRTNVYNYISGCFLLAAVLGSTIGSLLLSNYLYYLNGLSIMCYVITACIAITIPSHLGRDSEIIEDSRTTLLIPDDSGALTTSPTQLSISTFRSEKVSGPYCVYLG